MSRPYACMKGGGDSCDCTSPSSVALTIRLGSYMLDGICAVTLKISKALQLNSYLSTI